MNPRADFCGLSAGGGEILCLGVPFFRLNLLLILIYAYAEL